MGEAPLLEVGQVGKAHGLRGDVMVRFTSDVEERRRPGATFETDKGPLRIISARPHQKSWLVTFEGVTDRAGADAIRGLALRAEAVEDPDVVFVHEVVGRRLVDETGTDRGEIVAMEANPAADLLVLDDGRVVPLTFVVEIDDDVVRVEAPAGLFDL
ncbi:MAG: ribosome maturation factor RimM [Actinomycetota bacterium]